VDPAGGETWYDRGLAWALDRDILVGHGGTNYAPEAALTREQMLVMLYRYASYVDLLLPTPAGDEELARPEHVELKKKLTDYLKTSLDTLNL